jgi:hypothetical protein
MFTNDNEASAIRFPSTANLYISSADRDETVYPSASNFVISKKENILAGFFTRFAMVEININWFLPNISQIINNNTFTVTVTGAPTPQHTVTVPDGFYTVASLMDYIVAELNAFYGANTFDLVGQPGTYSLVCTSNYVINDTKLARALSFDINVAPATAFEFYYPDLVPAEYSQLDFVCTNLTYQQGLKDADTANITRDVIYRWAMGWDNEPALDAYGYPIFQGYTSFVTRRYLSFPKQIKWGKDQPLGQLAFEVYDSKGKILQYNTDFYGGFQWGMQLLVSEQ